ncbi:hypothetical protein, partial [Lysobacter enzymogenes]|uniref:hypothetical protein n=1 Tax=Lysobacter enzymogenes TaxID=69 RepID=UPI00197C2AF8
MGRICRALGGCVRCDGTVECAAFVEGGFEHAKPIAAGVVAVAVAAALAVALRFDATPPEAHV